VLLVQAADDGVVPSQQAAELIEGLPSHNIDHDVIMIPSEIHDLARYSSCMMLFSAADVYFDRHGVWALRSVFEKRMGVLGILNTGAQSHMLPSPIPTVFLTYARCKSQLLGEGSMTRRIDILLAVSCILSGLMTTLSPARAQTPAPGTSFRDCSNGCPEMVVVQQGRFTMGAPAGEEARENLPNERRGRSVPQHLITIRHKLAIAKFDVTRDEYAQFVAETNRPDPDSCTTLNTSGDFIATNGNWHSPGFPQTGKDPVVCVSWDDAQAYVAWLSAKTGHVYRLPTEAEWEYAARAGTTTARYGSDNPAEFCRYTNVGDLDYGEQHPGDSGVNRACRDGYAFTSPVGIFPPNQFGLYDMLGNVLDWNEDCWNPNYSGAPTDGTAWQSGDCGRRVARGGSWDADLSGVRSANRRAPPASSRNTTVGFRVARTL
jgi:formylglycine-generating enzyme required for sulfatase activity